jgi:hypothetical protein
MTLEEIQGTVKAARDSVWVVNSEIDKLEVDGLTTTEDIRDAISRNVAHLKIITSKSEIVESGEDIADLISAIARGEAKLAEDIW